MRKDTPNVHDLHNGHASCDCTFYCQFHRPGRHAASCLVCWWSPFAAMAVTLRPLLCLLCSAQLQRGVSVNRPDPRALPRREDCRATEGWGSVWSRLLVRGQEPTEQGWPCSCWCAMFMTATPASSPRCFKPTCGCVTLCDLLDSSALVCTAACPAASGVTEGSSLYV